MNDQTQIPAAKQASDDTGTARPALAGPAGLADVLPPHVWFCISAVFHYLGPAFAVLLFDQVGVLGMAWLRIATAALIFAPLTRPWRVFARAERANQLLLLAFGACLAVMNCSFYLALDRLPISLVAAIEFVGTIAVALVGLRSRRNVAALAIAVAGTLLLIDVKWSSDPIGLFWAFLNGALFVGYIVIGHRVARAGIGIAGLGTAMAIAFLVVLPIGFREALPAFSSPQLLIAAIGVGVCSSVIPYVCDQLAMARLPRASFALMLSLLPLTATLIGVIVLRQLPDINGCAGIAMVIVGVAMHRPMPH
ncbi:EamA family transporter [Mesorhizobium hawassense]|uniref:EamA family transporter n=1 Tax=Mesorhizobium hawassense TaxID=1209954 RepID=A0A330HI93_9HYPH|nr:DMT family transporter [Mesorhizobium hawassense]RAZ88195.1 EamA family transporter [Mesorhizobium hawassense]